MADAVAPRRTNWLRWLPAAYLLLSLAWIFGSDRLLDQWFAEDPELLLAVGTIKGVLFVTFSAALLYVLVSTRPPAAGVALDGEHSPHLWRPLVAFVIFGAPVALAGYLVYSATYRNYLHDTSAALSTGAQVSARSTYLWLDGRSRAMRQFVGNPTVIHAAQSRASGVSPEAVVTLEQRLEALRASQGFSGARVYSVDGEPLAGVGDGEAMSPVLRDAIDRVLEVGSPQVVFHSPSAGQAGDTIHVDFVARFGGRSLARGSPRIGVVVARGDAAEMLALLEAPTLSGLDTGVTVLVERDGDLARIIARRGGPPVKGGVPESLQLVPERASARVIGGDLGPFEAHDEFGEHVLAAGYPVQGTRWFVVTQVSLSEIARAQRRSFALAWGLGAVGLAMVAGLVLLWWRNEQSGFALRLRREQVRADAATQRFAMISRHGGDAMLLVGPDGRILDANERVAEIYGRSAAEIEGMTIFDLQADEVRELELVHAGPEPGPGQRALHIESRHRRRDGTTFPVEVTATRVEFQGHPYVFSIVRDISQRKAQEIEIARLAAERDRLLHRLRLQFDEMPIGCILVDMTGAVVDVNPAFERLFGYRLADAPASDPYELVFPPETRDKYRRRLAALSAVDTPTSDVYSNVTRDGRRITCRWTASALREADGTQVGVLAMCQDVTASMAAEAALRSSEEQLRAAQRLAQVGSWELDLATGRTRHSDETYRICGVRPEEFPNTVEAGFALVHPDDREPLRAQFAALLGGGTGQGAQFRVLRPDGSVVHVSARGRIERDPAGRPLRVLGTMHDITASVLAQNQIERQRDLYDLLAQSNQLIARCGDELELYAGLAELVVQRGGFAFAWVAAPGPGTQVVRLAASGDDHGFIDAVLEAAAAGGLGPELPIVGAMQDRRTSLADRMPTDPRVAAPSAILAARHIRSVAAFPIGPLDAPGPVLMVYGSEPDTFDPATVATLEDMAEDTTFGLAAMATRRALDERTLLLQTIIDGSDSPIHATDAEGRILLANAAWRRLNGCTEDTVTARRIDEILRPEVAALQRSIDAMILASGRPKVFEERGTLDGQEVLWLVTRFPLRDATGGIYGVGGIAADVTGLRRMEEELVEANRGLEARIAERTRELEAAKERAERADRTKSSFLSTMSHELRTPLNSILGFTDILIDGLSGPVNDEQRRQLGIVKGASLHLLELINDVLDISRVEAGELRLEIDDVDVTEVLRQRVQELTPLAERKGIALECEVFDEVAPIRSDRRRVSQIIGNLLSNAVKFTDHGGVTASIRRRGESLDIVVRDTGCGILAEDLGKLFVPFAQLKRTQAAATEGTGLGLAISRHFARALGGDISVMSEPGVGSMFAVVLPLRTEVTTDPMGTGMFRRIPQPPA